MATEPTKRCSCCGGLFPLSSFGRNRQTPDGRAYYTLEHAAQKQREFRQENPESVAASKARYLNKLRRQNDESAGQ